MHHQVTCIVLLTHIQTSGGVLLLLNSQVVLQHLGHAECRRPLWNEFWLKVEHNFYTLAAQVFWNHRQILKKYIYLTINNCTEGV